MATMTSVHLLVLVHGMWGNSKNLSELARVARGTHSESNPDGIGLHILTAETITGESTYDGIDWGGEKVASEILETVKDLRANGKKVVRFSITGYSLGGLISRYCIGVLDQQDFFREIEPVNFNSFATPHCGLPTYASLISTLASKLGPKLLSRTGEQFYCADNWSSTSRPLLVVMADPSQLFHQALKKFRNITIYANAINDITVPYVTAAIEIQDPFVDSDRNGIEVDLSDEYPGLITNYYIPDVPPPPVQKPITFSVGWFKNLDKLALPPRLQYRFPLNFIMYAFLPVLIPALVTFIISRFALATRASRSRIRVLEKEANGGERKFIIHLLAEIEREMEEAVADLVVDSDPTLNEDLTVQNPLHPVISPHHRKIAEWLNTLPIRKELTYFEKVLNAHAMIVCRDINRFHFHRLGEPVLRHWASQFAI